MNWRIFLALTVLLVGFGLIHLYPLDAQGPKEKGKTIAAKPQWIWLAGKAQDNQTAYFRKEIVLKQRITSAKLYATCDNSMTIFINGKEVVASDAWDSPVFRDVTEHFRFPGKGEKEARNVIAVRGHNLSSAAGLLVRLVLETPKKGSVVVVTDGSWRVADKASQGWNHIDFNDSGWAQATVVGKLGGAPWVSVTDKTLSGAARLVRPTATPIELIKAKKDFKVELLYTVPRETQGSWVSLCADDKGRFYASDQYGKLFRITLIPNGVKEEVKVEELPIDLGEAQGLVWAFDSLYVVVSRGKKYESGLYRLRSSKGDDVLDAKEQLRAFKDGGEHGLHGIVVGPDKKSLYVSIGNHVKMTQLASSKVPQIWGEDTLLPRLWDASGHAVGILAPGGCIYKVDLDGKNWELVSMGYRNQYDIAFNRDGELFTYDADMEWDMNLPWYRPTRICHAVPGSEFGWRGGTGKMYENHPDNLPAVVNIGPGSPTGVVFGYGAKFPAKYQEALYACDWSYGKLYAVHLQPHGSSYTAEFEEFITGTPLPLTDPVISPKDGAMYFAIGGRNTMSGLYRVTYVGKEATEPAKGDPRGADQRAIRHKLEAFYGKKDPQAVAAAWPYLSSPDRFLRYAARTVLEFQEPAAWQDKALGETNPIALTHAILGLARAGDKALQPRLLEALERVDWAKLTPEQQVDYLRTYQLAFIRMGAPEPRWKERVGKRLDAFYPAAGRDVNAELGKLISYLEVPGGVAKTLALIAKAPTQEEQIEYALALRTVKTGWTRSQRAEYFNWFHKAATYRGGHSFLGFMRNIRADAVKSLSDAERVELKTVVDNVPQPAAPKITFKQREVVKKYTVAELAPVVEKGLAGRNFERGRNLFAEAKCFVCHRFSNEGGGTGPDLTMVSGRFSVRDLLESIIEPSKTVSDQYQAVVITTTDGRTVVGRIVNLGGDTMNINTDMLDPDKIIGVNRNLVESITPSPVSMMPDGLLDTFTQDEILDLLAYLLSRGERGHKMFRRE